MSNLLEITRATIGVADGGWSTLLYARGFPANVPAEMASVQQPQLVLALAREYLGAGARFLTTNTFAANRFAFERRGIKPDGHTLNVAAAQLARQAIGEGDACVAGCIGPSGKILAVREADESDVAEAFAAQARALAEGGVDLLVLETFSELAEVLLALRAVKDATGLPVAACLSFDSGPQRTRTMMGVEAERCADALTGAGADLVGCNCGAGIAHVLPAVVALRANTDRALWIKPSAGLPDLEDGQPVYAQTPEEFSSHVPTLLDAGANIVGGCCGVGPEHIRRVAALVESRRRREGRQGA